MESKDVRNKDLILREELALERTKMAQHRTFLAFLRTALYFPVAGISLHQALNLSYGIYLQWAGIGIGIFILLAGLVFNQKARQRLEKYRESVGGAVISQQQEGN